MKEDKLIELVKLVNDPRKILRLADKLGAAVALSVRSHPMSRFTVKAQITRDEEARRATWRVNWAMERIRDNKWGVERVIDKYFEALCDFIDKKETTVSPFGMWSASE